MRYEVRALVRLPLRTVWAWWTDHGRPGHRERVWHGLGWSQRLTVSSEDGVIELRETMLGLPVLAHRLELHPARHAFREEAGAFTAWWRFEEVPEGTLVTREVETRRWAPRALTLWAARRDLETHAQACERSHLS